MVIVRTTVNLATTLAAVIYFLSLPLNVLLSWRSGEVLHWPAGRGNRGEMRLGRLVRRSVGALAGGTPPVRRHRLEMGKSGIR